jgi:hypothetical protein
MRDALLGGNVQLIVVILPESAAGLYSNVKRFGDIMEGVATQCVVCFRPKFQSKPVFIKGAQKWSHKLEKDASPQGRRGALDQYFNNLILKWVLLLTLSARSHCSLHSGSM